MVLLLCGCEKYSDKTEVTVFVAASLNNAMEEIAKAYEREMPDVKIMINADSSGTLLTQIKEGASCDIFFPAALKQMDMLEEQGLLYDKKRVDLLYNQLVVIALKNSNTEVSGINDLQKAESLALADGSVPVGKYTRAALVNVGILKEREDVEAYTTEEISEALGEIEISEQGNVSKVLLSVVEGSCQVGTTYYSDIFGYENKLEVLEYLNPELTGDIIYPLGRVVNSEATVEEMKASDDFFEYLQTDECKAVFEKYYFRIDL